VTTFFSSSVKLQPKNWRTHFIRCWKRNFVFSNTSVQTHTYIRGIHRAWAWAWIWQPILIQGQE